MEVQQLTKHAHSRKPAETGDGERGMDWVGLAFALSMLLQLALNVPRGLGALLLVQDDFFYYDKIAVSILHGHGSTFNGLVPTNGYHPLWMVVVVILNLILPALNQVIFAVNLLSAVAAFLTYFFGRKILSTVCPHRWSVDLTSVSLAWLCYALFNTGMEIILTIPLGLYLLLRLLTIEHDSNKQLFTSAFVASLVVLSRLDSVIWIAFLLIALAPTLRKLSAGSLLAVAAGCIPVPAYLLANRVWFGAFMPVSGKAKQLRTAHTLSLTAIKSIHALIIKDQLIVLVAIVGLVFLPLLWKKLPARWRYIAVATLLFPFAHFAFLSLFSDWPVWGWYLYGFAIAGYVAAGELLSATTPRPRLVLCIIACLFFAANIAQIVKTRNGSPRGRALATEFIKNFSTTHGGIYAMGDRAGAVAMLINNPIVQIEGLVMDAKYLQNIEAQNSLLPVLRSYGVRYYVANFYGASLPEGCFTATEPTKGGPTVKHMQSMICDRPLATFNDAGVGIAIYDIQSSPDEPAH